MVNCMQIKSVYEFLIYTFCFKYHNHYSFILLPPASLFISRPIQFAKATFYFLRFNITIQFNQSIERIHVVLRKPIQ